MKDLGQLRPAVVHSHDPRLLPPNPAPVFLPLFPSFSSPLHSLFPYFPHTPFYPNLAPLVTPASSDAKLPMEIHSPISRLKSFALTHARSRLPYAP